MAKINFELGVDNIPCVCVDDRYLIYLDVGVVYDTIEADLIPEYVFDIRDYWMLETKRYTLTEIIEKYIKK